MSSMSEKVRENIIVDHLERYSERQIADRQGTSKSTVHDIIKRYRATGIVTKKENPGARRKTDYRFDRKLQRQSKADRFATAIDLWRKNGGSGSQYRSGQSGVD